MCWTSDRVSSFLLLMDQVYIDECRAPPNGKKPRAERGTELVRTVGFREAAIDVGHGFGPGHIRIMKFRNAKAGARNQGVDFLVQAATSADAFPNRSEVVLPRLDSWFRCEAVFQKKQTAAGP